VRPRPWVRTRPKTSTYRSRVEDGALRSMSELLVLENATVIPATETPPFIGAVVIEGGRIARSSMGCGVASATLH